MLGLKLRHEFLGRRPKGTVELSDERQTGATQIAARDFLAITYPTYDLLKGLEALDPQQGRPLVVIGERGLGKSHLLATLYHAVNDPAATRSWLEDWSSTLKDETIAKLPLREGMQVIGESLHRQRFKFLWDVLFERHPHGGYIRGKWEGQGAAKTDVPSDELLIELFTKQPTMLLLDEFQTWYDGLTNTKQYPWKQWAFNTIQLLAEIAEARPELLVLVVSVRNGSSDAYQQIHRNNPVQIDFKGGGNAERLQRDRRRMLLHRLFENRLQVDRASIEARISTHVGEYLRLTNVPTSEHERRTAEFIDSWPFAPHLLRLLEEQVLVATDAQENRDLIRILANLFKSRGEVSPILTAADFRLDSDTAGIGALLDSVANEHHRSLRAKAQQNILSVLDAVADHKIAVPHLQEIMSSLWLRSIAVGNQAGAERAVLQADITRDRAVDDNSFQVELSKIVENSFNIHEDGRRLVFRDQENPQAKVMAAARNAKLFADGSDLTYLRKTIRHVIDGGDQVARGFRVIALPKNWQAEPWLELEESERPDRWDGRIPVLVLPEAPENVHQRLGPWLAKWIGERRNTARYLLPRAGSENAFTDPQLLLLARASLKAQEWSSQGQEYKALASRLSATLREELKKRFDRFAILLRWNFSDPAQCQFSVENLKKQGEQVPEAIDEAVRNNLFVPEDFEEFVKEAARNGASLGKLLRELQEPRPAGHDCIPWLGETAMKERLVRLCARGEIAINARNLEMLQALPGEDEEAASKRLKPKLSSFTGRQMDEVLLQLPEALPTTGGSVPAAPQGAVTGQPDKPLYQTGNGAHSETAETSDTTSVFPKDIFGGGMGDPSAKKAPVPLFNPATSPLNLLGKLEAWSIQTATGLQNVSLGVGGATRAQLEKLLSTLPDDVACELKVRTGSANGAQLRELLKKLPDGMTFELALEKTD